MKGVHMKFTAGFEKTALSPEKIRAAANASSRLGGGKSGRAAAQDLADEYRIFKSTGKSIAPKVKEVNQTYPRMSKIANPAAYLKAYKTYRDKKREAKPGVVKLALSAPKLPGPLGGLKAMGKPTRVDPVTSRDALGASSKLPFSQPISHFGNRPRSFLKAPSRVRHAA